MSDRKLLTLDDARELVGSSDYKTSKPIDFSMKGNKLGHDGDEYVLTMGKKDKRITATGITNLVRVLDLPSALPKKLIAHPDLVGSLVNDVAKRKGAFLRTLTRGNSVVSFVDTEQTLISNSEILDAADEELGEPQFDNVHVKDDMTSSFTIVSDKNDKLKIGKNDRFLGGVRIENNPLRSSSTKIEAYLERLVCLNGQIAPSSFWEAPKTIEGDSKEWVQLNIGSAVKVSEEMFLSIAKLADNKISADIMDFVESIYEQLKVPEKARDLITRRIVKEGATTLYDIFNHITYVASNYRVIREDNELSTRLMRIGGHFAQHVESMCNSCNRPTFVNA